MIAALLNHTIFAHDKVYLAIKKQRTIFC